MIFFLSGGSATPRLIKMSILSQENELSCTCTCVLGGYIYIYLCLYDFSIRFWKDTESMFDVAKLKSSIFCGLNHNPVLSSFMLYH